ncbi:DUF1330 domain-containing protein [Emcibacter sp.]|uniref:DUF1330 domain-containing protein n=1 Tax=Emcibacter sp. TaxID=1979954 RepID=UPI003A8F5F42
MDSYMDPTEEDFKAFLALPKDQPIAMLNLVRFKERAEYDDGRQVTGAEAYGLYSRESGPIFARVGGSILWKGSPELMLIGPSEEKWDMAFIARYPDAAAFLEMIGDPAYRQAVRHRQAAVETSRLIRCREL